MNTTTIESMELTPEAKSARPKLLYPILVIAGFSVTLFSLLGIAALTGIMPTARSHAEASSATSAQATNKPMVPAAAPTAAATTPASNAKARNTAVACSNCGKVESVTTVERSGNSTGVGAVAGGITGALLGNQMGRGDGRTVMTLAAGAGGAYLGDKIEQNSRRSTAYKIVVRMDNGTQRTIYQTEPPNVVIGGPVQIVGNTVVAGS